MSTIQYVSRRGVICWWRKKLSERSHEFALAFSLGTADRVGTSRSSASNICDQISFGVLGRGKPLEFCTP